MMKQRPRTDFLESHVPPSSCPNCGKVLDMAMGIEKGDHRPEPGCISVCMACSHISVFGDDMMLRNPTSEEILWMADARNYPPGVSLRFATDAVAWAKQAYEKETGKPWVQPGPKTTP
jgi:hypothetical protein